MDFDYSDEEVQIAKTTDEFKAAKEAQVQEGAEHAILLESLPSIEPAPEVSTFGASDMRLSTKKQLTLGNLVTNPKLAALDLPIQGPVDPSKTGGLHSRDANHHTGNIEKFEMSDFAFRDAMLGHDLFGPRVHDTVWGESVLTMSKRRRRNLTSNQNGASPPGKRGAKNETEGGSSGSTAAPAAGKKDMEVIGKRLRNDDPTDLDNFKGPWAKFDGEDERKKYWENEQKEMKDDLVRQEEELKAFERRGKADTAQLAETSKFYGKAEYDYQGRSWMTWKAGENQGSKLDARDNRNFEQMLDHGERWCYLPKKCVHEYTGHTQGIQTIRLLPKTGHLFLSAGLDSKIKIWEFYGNRRLMRDYTGHDFGVKDIQFTNDGSRFYSCSFDKNINLWDTETGKIITSFTNNKTPYCIAIHPDKGKQNTIIVGSSNKKAVEYDANIGKIVQEYDEHLGTVSAVHFCQGGKRILTSGEDKKIMIWEYGIPVVVKHIADPNMHFVPTLTMHPTKQYICGQSQDNRIITYEAHSSFKFVRAYKYSAPGYLSAGYGCEIGFSSDGQFVMSGDGNGKLWFWGFGNQRNYKALQAHNGPTTACLWHPKHTSKVLTCGHDGIVKLWD